jgi:hypothetical protein
LNEASKPSLLTTTTALQTLLTFTTQATTLPSSPATTLDLDFRGVDSESFCANGGSGLLPADNLVAGSYPTQILYIDYVGSPLTCSFTPVGIDITGCSPELTDIVYKIDQSSYRLLTGQNIVEIDSETNRMIFTIQDPKSARSGSFLISVVGSLPTG